MPNKKTPPNDDSEVIENFDMLDNLDVVQNETDWRMFQHLEKYEKPRTPTAGASENETGSESEEHK